MVVRAGHVLLAPAKWCVLGPLTPEPVKLVTAAESIEVAFLEQSPSPSPNLRPANRR